MQRSIDDNPCRGKVLLVVKLVHVNLNQTSLCVPNYFLLYHISQ